MTILLCGCSHQWVATIEEEPVPLAAAPESGEQVIQAVCVVDERSSEPVHRAAREFAQSVYEDTNGTLQIEVVTSNTLGLELTENRAQFAFADGARDAALSRYFPLLARPFCYQNYPHFSMALNSSKVLAYLSEDMVVRNGLIVLGAYYQGSNHLVAGFELGDMEDLLEIPAYTEAGTGTGSMLELLGAVPQTRDTGIERLGEVIASGEGIAELSLEELHAALSGEEITDVPEDERLYVSLSYHTITPVWLLADNGFYGSLTASQRAAVSEARAVANSILDMAYLRAEGEHVQALRAAGIELTEENAIRGQVLKQEYYELDRSPEEQYLLDLLEEMQ